MPANRSTRLLGVPPRLTFSRGFTLTELAIVLLIVALLLGGMLLPLSAQDEIRRTQETQRLLANAREALIGFAVANGRFPCPAIQSPSSHGLESPSGGGSCTSFYGGFLPAATLGLGPQDSNGLLLDAWGQPIRYAVWSNGSSNPLTTTDGIKNATMASIAGTPLLSVCASSAGIDVDNCGTTAGNKLTDAAPVVLFSLGKNGAGAGADEAANTNGDPVFVDRDPDPNYDDLVIWLSPNILFNRMIAAGRLP